MDAPALYLSKSASLFISVTTDARSKNACIFAEMFAVNGSAGKDGNTAILINTIFEELHQAGFETEMVQLSGQIIEPCKACWACGYDRDYWSRE